MLVFWLDLQLRMTNGSCFCLPGFNRQWGLSGLGRKQGRAGDKDATMHFSLVLRKC